MKKLIALILALIMVFALFAGCGKAETGKSDDTATTNKPATTSGAHSSNVTEAKPVTDSIGITRYPAAEGKNTYTRPEGLTLVTIDKDKVHPSDSATFKMGCTSNPSSLCLYTDTGTMYAQIPLAIFYDSLVYYDSINNEIVPGLATSWEWLDDYTLRFKLREDVKSHMGDPFTASDVLYSVQWGCSNPKLSSSYGKVFDAEKCKVVDKYTVDIAYLKITPFALYDLASTKSFPMVVEASVEKLGGKEASGRNPLMGTGPYKLKEWDETSQTVYAERNEDYWAALPYYKYYELHTVNDSTTRSMGLEAGDFDYVQSPAPNAVFASIDNENIATYMSGGGACLRWDINSDREPFNVKEVRQALALAVNYDAISQVAYQGYSDPGDSLYPYSLDWHTSPAEGEEEFYYYYDIERAKAKLVEAGYPDGFEIGIVFGSGLSDLNAAVEIINNGLTQINVKANLLQYEAATCGEIRTKLDYDSMLGNQISSSPASSLKAIDPRVSNWVGSGWLEGKEDEIYALIDKCQSTRDLDECYKYLAEFQDLYRELCPSISIACGKNYNTFNGKIANVAYDFGGAVYVSSIFPAEYLGA